MHARAVLALESRVTGEPALSVIVVTPDDFETIRSTVRHLQAQTARDRIELVIAAPVADNVVVPEDVRADIGSVRVVEVGPIETLSHAKAQAIAVAAAPFIAFVEDHSFAGPDWAASLIAAFAQGYVVVGPQMFNANPTTMLSWAAMFMHFGAAVESPAGEKQSLASSHNTAYRRDLLLSLGDELVLRIEMELFLLEAVRRSGHRMYHEPAAHTRHVNISRLAPWLAQHYVGGRLYGALRTRFEGWSLLRRVAYAGGSPLIPVIRFRRIIDDIRRTSHAAHLLPRVLPALALGLLAHALGEATGYLLGLGDTERRYSGFEVRRRDLVIQADRAVW